MAPLLAAPIAHPTQTAPAFGYWELRREPIGVVAGFSPYNFPLFIACGRPRRPCSRAHRGAQASPLTPFGPDALAAACVEVGLPPGVLNIVHGTGSRVRRWSRTRVDLVTFTGSTVGASE